MNENYLDDCLEKFHDLPDQIQEMVGGFEASIKIKNIEEEYGVDLSFAVILMAIGELATDDLADYLNLKFNLDKAKGEKIAERLDDEIFKEVLDLLLENIDLESIIETDDEIEGNQNQFGPITNLSPEEKKELILKTFGSSIISALQADPAKIQDFNIAIFQAFYQDERLEVEAERLLYVNQEKVSDHHITLDGHPASPTIANWLKDFIKKYGSDLFDEVALAEYLSQSPNVRQLKSTEKELVRKVLKLYRNLSFFPESMDGVPIEQWEVFPVDRSLLTPVSKKSLAPLPITTEVTTENVVPVDPVVAEKQKVIFDLQKALAKYSTSSLEYKAISQEINRLSKK